MGPDKTPVRNPKILILWVKGLFEMILFNFHDNCKDYHTCPHPHYHQYYHPREVDIGKDDFG